jgi:ribosomal 50S subunit-recycling heat shock protein
MIRLDKYLKLSRLVKRRAVAREMSEIGAVRINMKKCKPSSSVSDGDIIEIAYPRRILTVKVLSADELALKRNTPAYELVSEKRADPNERPW